MRLTLTIETEREDDGRWLAEVPDLPGVMAYGESEQDAIAKTTALALHVIADRVEHGEAPAGDLNVQIRAA
jgi:predicted RNase H-like HicB family nuclease